MGLHQSLELSAGYFYQSGRCALGAGNAVLAKPAEQTPGVAWEAVKLLHAAGVPEGALQLMHGPGETVGAALVAEPQVVGVVFTGATQLAKAIQRALAAKDGAMVPLFAKPAASMPCWSIPAPCPSRW